jgi:hypothetical protein
MKRSSRGRTGGTIFPSVVVESGEIDRWPDEQWEEEPLVDNRFGAYGQLAHDLR